jgi:hypothetical protein
VSDLKEDVDKQLSELKEIQTNRWIKLRRPFRIWKRNQ